MSREEERRRRLRESAGQALGGDRSFFERAIGDATSLVASLPRGLASIFGAPILDTIDLAKTAIPGGSAGFDDPDRFVRLAHYPTELVKSIGTTAAELPFRLMGGGLPGVGTDLMRKYEGGMRELGEMSGLPVLEGYANLLETETDKRIEAPVTSLVEDLGNISIVGAAAAKPVGMAARAAAGRQAAAPLSRTLRPIKGMPSRAANRQIVREIAESGGEGANLARTATILDDIVGHPYRAGWRAAKGYTTASGRTVGEVVRESGLGSAIASRFPQATPEGRELSRTVQETLREPSTQLRRAVTENFDPKLAVEDARASLYAIARNEPEVLREIGVDLPEMPRDMGPEQLVSSLRAVREAQESGRRVTPFEDPLERMRADLTILELEGQVRGLPEGALVDAVPQIETFGSTFHRLREGQTAARAAGLGDEQLWRLYGGERYILPERLLGDEVGSALTDLGDDVSRARQAYRTWNDPVEQQLVARGDIPEEGTRFRVVRDAEGEPVVDPETGLQQVERIAEPTEPVPFETQGPSARQGRKLRGQQRRLESQRRQVARLGESEATQRARANQEIADLERRIALDIEDLAKRAVAAGDDPSASRLWDEYYEMVRAHDQLADTGGLTVPQRVRTAMEGVEQALDEVIALAGSPALRNMLDPETYTKIRSALDELGDAEEFLAHNESRLAFFDRLDEVEAAATRGRGQRYPGGKPGGRLERAQQAVQGASQQVARAQERARGLFDPDQAATRLQKAVDRYKKARAPYRETLLKAQTRARERLRRLRNTQRRLATAERRFVELQEQVNASIEAQPAPARDLLRIGNAAEEMHTRLTELADELDLDPEVVSKLRLDEVPRDLEQIISEGYDLNYVHTAVNLGEDVQRPTAGVSGPIYRPAGSTRRQAGGTSPRETSFREILRRRVTDVRVAQFKEQMIESVQTDFTRTAKQLAREELGYSDEQIQAIMDSPDPTRLERELAVKGYTAFKPGDLFEGVQRRTGVTTYGPEAVNYIKTDLYNLLKRSLSSRQYDDFLREWWNPATNAWKKSVLALRPAWHVYNIVGGAVMATLGGRIGLQDLHDFLPVATEAWRRHRHGYGLSTADAQTFSTALGARGQGRMARTTRKVLEPLGRKAVRNLEKRGIDLDNLPDIEPEARQTLFEHGITRREIADQPPSALGEAAQSLPGAQAVISSRAYKGTKDLVGRSYRANALIDDVYRSTVYLARRLEYGDALEPALARVVQSMGDYTKMTPFERRYVRSAFPFYAWVRHITGVTMRQLAPDSITRTMILAHVTSLAAEPDEAERLLPEWAQGDIHVGDAADGTPLFLATRGLNPFADVLAPITHGGRLSAMGALSTAHPAIQTAFEQVSGISTLTGRPFSTPVPRRDPEGRELPTPPPLSEQVVGSIPQLKLARDLARSLKGETLTRYGTGEPLLIPGVESPPIASKISQQVGFNIRPLDVESMRAQRIKNRYAEMRQRLRFESQQESYNQETGLPLLPSVLGGRG